MIKILENLFLAAPGPLSLCQLIELLKLEAEPEIEELRRTLEQLSADYKARGLQLIEIAGGYRLTTQEQYAVWVGHLIKKAAPAPISEEARVTLAIIAYLQPITRTEIEQLRGVDCESVLYSLANTGIIKIIGTLSGAFLYGTTQIFLEKIGINTLSDLPPLPYRSTP